MLLNQFIASSSFPLEGICLSYPMVVLFGNCMINRKDIIRNKNSEKGYRDVVLNISGTVAANVTCATSNLMIPCQRLSNCLCIFTFPTCISKSTIGDTFGSNACTLIFSEIWGLLFPEYIRFVTYLKSTSRYVVFKL